MSAVVRRAVIGAVVGAVIGLLIGLLLHTVFDVAGSPTGFELVGAVVGLVFGGIVGAFYAGAVSLPRESPRGRGPTSTDRSPR